MRVSAFDDAAGWFMALMAWFVWLAERAEEGGTAMAAAGTMGAPDAVVKAFRLARPLGVSKCGACSATAAVTVATTSGQGGAVAPATVVASALAIEGVAITAVAMPVMVVH